MSRIVRQLVVLGAALLVTGVGARAEDTAKPLRTMVYTVSYSSTRARLEQTSGFVNTAGGSTGSVSSGHGEVERRFATDEQGTLTVAIVAATKDGGLVADVDFAGKTITQSRVRVAIFSDGRLSYDPHTPLCPEAHRVLPFLARGLLAERTIATGETWTVTVPPPASGNTIYRIERVDGERAVIAINGNLTMHGAAGLTEHLEGKTTYATDVLSPISIELNSRARRDVSVNESEITDTHIVADLVSDSFPRH